jgi:signal peptidase I
MTWKEYRTLKQAREFVAGSRKLLRIHRDVLGPRNLQEIARASDDLAGAIKTRNIATVSSLREKLEMQLENSLPRQNRAALRENVEVLLVAVIVAMAVRTFFFQPFKIPTGSMQPTLYGVYPARPPWSMLYEPPLPYANGRPSIVERVLGVAVYGRIYDADGYRARGDHIFVDRFTYHFRKPRRGEVVVFAIDNIPYLLGASQHGRGTFYIKRLIGFEHDTVQIKPPYVLVNGKVVDDRPAFERIFSRQNGYHGYTIPTGARYIHSENDGYTVPAKHLFVLGDNSPNSLDARFWGSVPENDLVGRAMLVYWPFTKRFGLIE